MPEIFYKEIYMISEHNIDKPDIEYPCEWDYKIIGENVDELLILIEEVTIGLVYRVTPSNISSKGKYYSLNLTVEVPNELIRNLIYEKLQSSVHVRFVL